MEYYFVLTYVNRHDNVEHWIRLSAVDIVECLADFMIHEDNDETAVNFSIHTLDDEKLIPILQDFDPTVELSRKVRSKLKRKPRALTNYIRL
jgi:hypothetical protein